MADSGGGDPGASSMETGGEVILAAAKKKLKRSSEAVNVNVDNSEEVKQLRLKNDEMARQVCLLQEQLRELTSSTASAVNDGFTTVRKKDRVIKPMSQPMERLRQQQQTIPATRHVPSAAGTSASASANASVGGSRFSVLAQEDDVVDVVRDESQTKKEHVPPVFVQLPARQVNNALNGLDLLAAPGSFILSSAANGRTCVRTKSLAAREAVIEKLTAEKIGFFSYTPKAQKPIKVVLVGLEGYSEAEVLDELRSCPDLPKKPLSVRAMSRMDREKQQRVPLPLFIVAFPAGTRLAELKDVAVLFHSRVYFRGLRPSTQPIQCYRCQEYGHVSANCAMAQRCVKCGQSHASKECLVINDESSRHNLLCCLCGQMGHPASFRGCPKAQEFVARRQQARQQQQQQQQRMRRGGERAPEQRTRVAEVPMIQPQQQQQQQPVFAERRVRGAPTPVVEQPPPAGAWRQGPPPPRQQPQSDGLGQVLSLLMEMQADMRELKDRIDHIQDEFEYRMEQVEQQVNINQR